MNKTRKRVYAHIKQDRFIIESAEDATVWTGSTDVSNIATSVNHREGSASISFDKDGTTETAGQISLTYDTENQLNIIDYLRGKLRFWINLSSLTDVANVQLIIGEDASNNYVYQTADTDLSTGWNEITHDVDSPSGTNGDGAAWSSIGYIAIAVNFDATGDTLTSILVDAISVLYELNTNVESINLSGTGLATSALQTSGNALLTTIDADTGVIAGDTTSLDGKTPTLGNAAMAGSVPVTTASDDTLVTAIKTALEIMDDWDATHDSAASADGAQIVGEALSSQMTAVDAGDAARIALNLYGESVIAGYDWASKTISTTEKNPISSHHIEDTLINETNITTNTTTYAYVDMDGYKDGITFQHDTSGTAPTDSLMLTLEMSVQDDGTAPASCAYVDVTERYTGLASWIDRDCEWIIDTPIPAKYLRVKYNTSNDAGGDTDLTTYIKKVY